MLRRRVCSSWSRRSLARRGRIGGPRRSGNEVDRGGALGVLTIRARGVIGSIGVSSRSVSVTRTVSVSTRSSSVELVLLSLVVGRLLLVIGRVCSRKELGTDGRQSTDSERGAED
jgi:hypothetical protein